MKPKESALMRETTIKFQMNPLIAKIAGATERNKDSLECMITALEKYNAVCTRASITLSKDLDNCRKKLYPKTKPGSVPKK